MGNSVCRMVIRQEETKKRKQFPNQKVDIFHSWSFHSSPFLIENSVCILEDGCLDVATCLLHSIIFCWPPWCMHVSLAYACEKSVCTLDICISVHTIILISIFFFHSSRFFSCMLFFLSICIQKKPAGPTSASSAVPLPWGSRLQKSTSKIWGGGFSTNLIFSID